MTTWSSLTPQERTAVLQGYDQAANATERHEYLLGQLAQLQLQCTPRSLSRYLTAWREQLSLMQQVSSPVAVRDTAPQELKDDQRWKAWLQRRTVEQPHLSVMHACDIHAPFHDPAALDLFIAVVKMVQPDVIVVGSDFADFYLSSSFDIDRTRADYRDELDCVEAYWNPFIHRLREAAAGAQLVFIWGNHERRLLRYLQQHAGQFHARVMRDFINVIRCGGAVHYIGEVDAVRMGYLQVEHGSRHGINAMRQRLIDEACQINIMAGHIHRFSLCEIAGSLHTVQAVSSGALCPTIPHYLAAGQSVMAGAKWQQGTVVYTGRLDRIECAFEFVRFNRHQDELSAYFRGKTIRG